MSDVFLQKLYCGRDFVLLMVMMKEEQKMLGVHKLSVTKTKMHDYRYLDFEMFDKSDFSKTELDTIDSIVLNSDFW